MNLLNGNQLLTLETPFHLKRNEAAQSMLLLWSPVFHSDLTQFMHALLINFSFKDLKHF